MSEDFLTQTQTQHFSASQAVRLPVEADVFAKLVALIKKKEDKNAIEEKPFEFKIRKDMRHVEIGRHPDCEIVLKDKRVSGRHMRLYRDDSFRYFVEELSANGGFLNNHPMRKGDTRALHHGDVLSVCVHHGSNSPEPFAAYIFRLADQQAVAPPNDSVSSGAINKAQGLVAAPDATVDKNRRFVSDDWVRQNWDLRTVLGSGNFSEVRLGVQVTKPGGEKVAVKLIDKQRFLSFQKKRESILSLQSEAELLMKMKNTGVIRFYEWFETADKLYIAMEFLGGGDLLQFILENGCFAEPAARRIFRHIAEAVKYLHGMEIVHRDLKPENILLTSKDPATMVPKLADFGLARMNMKTRDCKTFCGTPHYFAPEVINTFQNRDQGQHENAGYGLQADMWSLGVILYIMLSGTPPFEEEGLYEQILEGRYEFDVQEWTQVTPEAKELVQELMQVNPKARLNIDQTLRHRWFTVDQGSSPSRGTRQLEFGEPDPMAKRPRTTDVAMMDCGAGAGAPLRGAAGA